MQRHSSLLCALLLLLLAACRPSTTESQVCQAAETFAGAYFNYDFAKALKTSTPESAQWLRFAASNIYEADIEVLRAMESGAEVQAAEVETLSSDEATVAVTVDNYMQRDTLGHPGHVVSGQTYCLRLVKRGETWLVDLDKLPRVRE